MTMSRTSKLENVVDFYPLSPMQRGMVFHSLMAPHSGLYVEQMTCRLVGTLSRDAFARAWQEVVQRHDVLRTSFKGEALQEPVQVVHRRAELPIEWLDWRGLSPVAVEEVWSEARRIERARGFKLSHAPLMRLAVAVLDDDRHILIWTYHHLLLDGWSTSALVGEVFARYDALVRGRHVEMPPAGRYRDLIVWLQKQDAAAAERFWRARLADITSPTPLPAPVRAVARAERDEAAPRQLMARARLEGERMEALRATVRSMHVTLSTAVQLAWAAVLGRHADARPVVFGATVAGRPADLASAEQTIGLFINTIPVPVDLDPRKTVTELLQTLMAASAEARPFEHVALTDVQRWSQVPAGTPLFETLLVYESYPLSDALAGGDLPIAIEDVRTSESTNYPLTLAVLPGDGLEFELLYDAARYSAAFAARLLDHLQRFLAVVSAAPGVRLGSMSWLGADEIARVLAQWDGGSPPFASDRGLHRLIEEQADRDAEAIAIVDGDVEVSYGELDRRASQLAQYLRERGVQAETRVAIGMERSIDLVVAMFAVLKAGGTYVPIDPAYPADRIEFMVEDTGAVCLLTARRWQQAWPRERIEVVVIERERERGRIETHRVDRVSRPVAGDALACIIYTSGSTGRPKGAGFTHKGLCRLTSQTWTRVAPGARRGWLCNVAFDGTTDDVWSTLARGGTVVVLDAELALSPDRFADAVRRFAVNRLLVPTGLFHQLVQERPDAFAPLDQLYVGGEALDAQALRGLERGGWPHHLYNLYGPTEGTTLATVYEVERVDGRETSVPIGWPLENTTVRVFDSQGRIVPPGMPGELLIGGPGVVRGYLDRPDVTADRFVPDPFATQPGERLYRTGDLVRSDERGALEFLGRMDQQVKIRGFRVELGEIEAAIAQHDGVLAVAVIARRDAAHVNRLVAFVVRDPDAAVAIDTLRVRLERQLPPYMVPSALVEVASLPLTRHGKVDRRALAALEVDGQGEAQAYVAPRDLIEAQLVTVWEDVLGRRPIGVRDNFFELGGHSLVAVRVVGQVHQRLGRTLPLVTLFQSPTIEGVAHALRGQEQGAPPSLIVPLRAKGTRRPLYIVHPSGGSVHWYTDLASRLGADQPVFGIQARGVHGGEPLHTTIAEMAAAYVEAIRQQQPRGPYHVASWSLGVIIAFEVARQLRAHGDAVGFVGMLDHGPAPPGQMPADEAGWLTKFFAKHLPLDHDELAALTTFDDQAAHVLDIAKRLAWVTPDVELVQFQHFVHVLRTQNEAWYRYRPEPFDGTITVFRVAEQPADSSQARDLDWGRLCARVDVVDVPGDHITMMQDPHVAAVAEAIKRALVSSDVGVTP